jgi:hypothetical protein
MMLICVYCYYQLDLDSVNTNVSDNFIVMTTKWKNNKVAENSGILFVQNVINEGKGTFNKVDGSNDVGIDGYVEFVQNESMTGLCIGVQIKSGDSYQDKNKNYVLIKSDKPHFEYWKNHSLPIAGLIYIPSEKKAYWVDITEFLQEQPSSVEKGPYTIKVNKENVFDSSTFEKFFEKFLVYKDAYKKEWNLARSLKGIVDFKPKTERFDSIKSLFYFHRDCKESWYYLIQLFRRENDRDIQRILIFTMKHLISHGDIYWHEHNVISEDIRLYGRSEIKTTFGQSEIFKLLAHIDENGVSRGSIGQDIYPILDLIPSKYDYIKKIILDKTTSDEVRSWAGVIVVNDFQYQDVQRAIYFCDSIIDNFPDSDNREWFQNIKQTLIEFGFVDFQG